MSRCPVLTLHIFWRFLICMQNHHHWTTLPGGANAACSFFCIFLRRAYLFGNLALWTTAPHSLSFPVYGIIDDGKSRFEKMHFPLFSRLFLSRFNGRKVEAKNILFLFLNENTWVVDTLKPVSLTQSCSAVCRPFGNFQNPSDCTVPRTNK